MGNLLVSVVHLLNALVVKIENISIKFLLALWYHLNYRVDGILKCLNIIVWGCWNDTSPNTLRWNSQCHVLDHLFTLLFFVVLIWDNALSLGDYLELTDVLNCILIGRGAASTLSGWIEFWDPLVVKLELREVRIRAKHMSLLSLYVLSWSCLHISCWSCLHITLSL